MKKVCVLAVYTVVALTLAGCGATSIAPNYQSTNTDLLRVGGDIPSQKEPETINMGSYCLQVTDKWKTDGKTPDHQTIWTKDTLRNVIPCR
jgi:hypothetical protein